MRKATNEGVMASDTEPPTSPLDNDLVGIAAILATTALFFAIATTL